MTPEEKVALLKEARVWDVIGFPGCIDKLIDLVAAHERERLTGELINEAQKEVQRAVLAERDACAKVCDEHGLYGAAPARDIRARGEK